MMSMPGRYQSFLPLIVFDPRTAASEVSCKWQVEGHEAAVVEPADPGWLWPTTSREIAPGGGRTQAD